MEPPYVLVVDDDRSASTQVAKFLTAEGYRVDVADDGKTALDRIAKQPYALAILDYQMPELDGVELYRRIRELRPETIGVFLTAYTTLDTVFPAITAGIERVLAKPVQRGELMPLVEELIGKPHD